MLTVVCFVLLEKKIRWIGCEKSRFFKIKLRLFWGRKKIERHGSIFYANKIF